MTITRDESVERVRDIRDGNLPVLKGSEKQIIWAEKIRKEVLTRLEGDMLAESEIEKLKKIVCHPELESAKFWIENRNDLMMGMRGANFEYYFENCN